MLLLFVCYLIYIIVLILYTLSSTFYASIIENLVSLKLDDYLRKGHKIAKRKKDRSNYLTKNYPDRQKTYLYDVTIGTSYF